MPPIRNKFSLSHSKIYSKSSSNFSSILERIKMMHSNSTNKYKSSLLALTAGIFSRNDLKQVGFQFSNTQYQTAMKKVKSQMFSLNDYQRHISFTKQAVHQNTISLITNYLQDFLNNLK